MHPSLPAELQRFFDPGEQAIPLSVLTTIRDGWEKMLPIGRLGLVQRLEREQTPVLRVLIADLAAAKLLLGVAEKPARDLADNLLLMGASKMPLASGRQTRWHAWDEERRRDIATGRMEREGGLILA